MGRPASDAGLLAPVLVPARGDDRRVHALRLALVSGEVSIAAPPRPRRDLWVGAFGNGGPRRDVAPALRLVVAITAGNYDQPGQGRMPTTLWRDVVLPSLRSPGGRGVG